MPDYDIRSVDLASVLELRDALIDPARRGRTAVTAGDEHPAARHVGAFHSDRLVGIASIHPEGMPGGHKSNAWRLDGVAVDFGHRGGGVGALLVERCLDHASRLEGRIAWCLAPAGTHGFFERLGFGRTGEPIDDPVRGPHHLLHHDLGPLTRSWAIEDA